MKKKKITGIIIVVLLFFLLLMVVQQLFMPKYMSGVYEGRLVGEYYTERKSHDVLFIGDCEVYENFSPMALWEHYGITSYIRGSPQQLIWQSYYLLEETLNYETPKVVVFSVLSMMYNEPQNEAYNRLTLDGMWVSKSKYSSVSASMTEGEQMITYVFPILRYHDRWRELSGEDFRYFFSGRKVSHNGYMMRCDIKPVTFVPTGPKLPDYTFGSTSYEYLDKITALCKENDIELVLIKSPSLYPYWYDEWDGQIADYARANELKYVNTLDMLDEIGIDWDTDTYNGGLHLNVFGAEKTSVFLGAYLRTSFDLADHRSDEKISRIWDKKIIAYYAMKESQMQEFEEYGSVKTLTY